MIEGKIRLNIFWNNNPKIIVVVLYAFKLLGPYQILKRHVLFTDFRLIVL